MEVLLNLIREPEITRGYPPFIMALYLECDFGPPYVDVWVVFQPLGYHRYVIDEPNACHEGPEFEFLGDERALAFPPMQTSQPLPDLRFGEYCHGLRGTLRPLINIRELPLVCY